MIYWKGIDLFLQFPFSLVNFLAIFDNFSKYILLAKKYFTYNHLPPFLHIFMIKIVMCSMKLVGFYNLWNLTLKKPRNCLKPITNNYRDQSKVLLYTRFSLARPKKSWNWISLLYISENFVKLKNRNCF